MISGQDGCQWAVLPKTFIPKESLTQGEPPAGILALLQLQPNHWWSWTKCQWWVLPRWRRDHTAQTSPGGFRTCLCSVGGSSAPAWCGKWAVRLHFLHPASADTTTPLYFSNNFRFLFHFSKDHRWAIWSHRNDKEGLSFQQITSAAAGTLELSEHNLFVLKEITLVDFVGWMDWVMLSSGWGSPGRDQIFYFLKFISETCCAWW